MCEDMCKHKDKTYRGFNRYRCDECMATGVLNRYSGILNWSDGQSWSKSYVESRKD